MPDMKRRELIALAGGGGLLTANGGKIEAASAGADRGTTVSIHLPFVTPASQPEVGPDD